MLFFGRQGAARAVRAVLARGVAGGPAAGAGGALAGQERGGLWAGEAERWAGQAGRAHVRALQAACLGAEEERLYIYLFTI